MSPFDSSKKPKIRRFPSEWLYFMSQLLVAIREAVPEDVKKKSPQEWYESEIEKNPNDKSLWFGLGSLQAKMGEHEKAVEAFARVTWLDPFHLKAWDAKGKALIRLSRFQEALECYTRATELDSRDERLWFQKGETLLKLKKYKEALICYERAMEVDPNFSDAWYGRGQALKELNSHTRASASDGPLEESKQLDTDPVLSEDATIQEIHGTVDQGQSSLGEAPERLSDNGLYREDLLLSARMYRYSGKPEEALRLYDKAIEVDPNLLDAWYSKGTLLYVMDRYEEALGCFEGALEIDPDHKWSKKRRAEIETLLRGRTPKKTESTAPRERSEREPEGASQKTIAPVSKSPGEEAARREELMQKADERVHAGDLQVALLYYDKVLETDRDHWKAWKGKGRVYSMMGRSEDATECIERATRLNPEDESLWVDEGKTLSTGGDRPGALAALKRALELDPELADAWFEAGTILQSLGFSRVAHNALREAFEQYLADMLRERDEPPEPDLEVPPTQKPERHGKQDAIRSRPMDLDRSDRNILMALWRRSRSVNELAGNLGIPVAECHRRVKKLHSHGILKRYTFQNVLSPNKQSVDLYRLDKQEGVVLLQGERLMLEIPHAREIGQDTHSP
ncbi:MAG: tetratricopeptide repeat protein, partial [Candidatus Thermoplasmatota archaeon]|nr:tetratricopeptide repeat protein [Candidatus Thermoplasmatota archaeon]